MYLWTKIIQIANSDIRESSDDSLQNATVIALARRNRKSA